MRAAGRLVAQALRLMSEAIVPNKTTPLELDALAAAFIKSEGAVASFLGYRDFPNSVCISVNEAVVHGIPGHLPLRDGDVVGLDLGVFLNGFHADGAWSYPVGTIDAESQRLLNVTHESLMQGIAKARIGNRIGDIAATVQRYVESNGYSVVEDLVGHGIGRTVHEEPSVPNFGRAGKGVPLREGMTICIEPMVNAGKKHVKTLADDWTMVTRDSKRSAHFEHTVAITKDGPLILTRED